MSGLLPSLTLPASSSISTLSNSTNSTLTIICPLLFFLFSKMLTQLSPSTLDHLNVYTLTSILLLSDPCFPGFFHPSGLIKHVATSLKFCPHFQAKIAHNEGQSVCIFLSSFLYSICYQKLSYLYTYLLFVFLLFVNSMRSGVWFLCISLL